MPKNFKKPILIGALLTKGERISPSLKKAFGSEKQIEYIPLRVQPKDLKNTIQCMKLVGVDGMTVSKKLSKKIFKFVSRKDKSAKTTGKIDMIVRKGTSLIGFDSEQAAQENPHKTASLMSLL